MDSLRHPGSQWHWVGVFLPEIGSWLTSFPSLYHPIHLHGHDFWVIGQATGQFDIDSSDLNLVNPPRRDVASLPANGYLAIAFKKDNPGSWLMHCHIAWHASQGLAIQFVERESEIGQSMANVQMSEDNCAAWYVTKYLNLAKPTDCLLGSITKPPQFGLKTILESKYFHVWPRSLDTLLLLNLVLLQCPTSCTLYSVSFVLQSEQTFLTVDYSCLLETERGNLTADDSWKRYDDGFEGHWKHERARAGESLIHNAKWINQEFEINSEHHLDKYEL